MINSFETRGSSTVAAQLVTKFFIDTEFIDAARGEQPEHLAFASAPRDERGFIPSHKPKQSGGAN
jgi:hypothetical protein